VEPVVEHSGKVLGHSRHPASPDGFDARLLHGVENRARLLPSRDQLAMNEGIMTGKLQRDRVGMTAYYGSIGSGQLARGLRQARLARNHARPFGCKGDFELGPSCDRPETARYSALERLGWAFLPGTFQLDVGHPAPASRLCISNGRTPRLAKKNASLGILIFPVF
jgi:hypothetical protein